VEVAQREWSAVHHAVDVQGTMQHIRDSTANNQSGHEGSASAMHWLVNATLDGCVIVVTLVT